jgi:hypothetical protein
MQEHLIPFFKVVFEVMLIGLLRHVFMGQHQIILEGTKNISTSSKGSIHLLNPREVW